MIPNQIQNIDLFLHLLHLPHKFLIFKIALFKILNFKQLDIINLFIYLNLLY